LAQYLKRVSVASDEIRGTRAEVFVEGVKSLMEETCPTRGLGGKGRVEDKDWEDGTRLERGMKRSVVRQP